MPLNITILYHLYQKFHMFWSFSRTIGRHKNTSKTQVCMQAKYYYFASSNILQTCFQFYVAFSCKYLFLCIFHKFKYFTKIGCSSKSNASFLWLKYATFVVCLCVLLGEHGYSWCDHVRPKVHTPRMLNILSEGTKHPFRTATNFREIF